MEFFFTRGSWFHAEEATVWMWRHVTSGFFCTRISANSTDSKDSPMQVGTSMAQIKQEFARHHPKTQQQPINNFHIKKTLQNQHNKNN
jgi:hypothetical protein